MGQATHEANYAGYIRVSMPRDAATWNVVNELVTSVAQVTFGANTGTAQNITHVGIGNDETGDGELLATREITAAPRTVGLGNAPRFPAGTLSLELNGDLLATLANKLLLLLFNNAALDRIGDTGELPGSAVAGQLWLSLHTQDPLA